MKRGLITLAVLVILAGALGMFYHQQSRVGKVETDLEANIITVTGKRSGDGTGGTGIITVGEGEHLRLEYSLSKGSLDVSVSGEAGDSAEDLMDVSVEELTNQISGETLFGGVSFSQTLEGSGEIDIEEQPGEYTVLFLLHDMTGEAKLSSVAE